MNTLSESTAEMKDSFIRKRDLGNTFNNPDFTVGVVIKDAFKVYLKNFMVNVGYAILILIPIALLYVGVSFALNVPVSPVSQPPTVINPQSFYLIIGFAYLAMLLVPVGLINAACDRLNDKPVHIVNMLKITLKKLLPVLGGTFVFLAMFVVGYVLFVVPGFMVMMALFVIMPSIIDEDRGVFESLKRSRYLTKGLRWKIFGIMVLYMIAIQILLMVPFVILFMLFPINKVVFLTMQPIIMLFLIAAWPCFVSSVFHHLRLHKEGHNDSEISKVFE